MSPTARLNAPTWQHELTLLGLAEHEVWHRVVDDLRLDVDTDARKIAAYAFMETLNNAIDHSASNTVLIA